MPNRTDQQHILKQICERFLPGAPVKGIDTPQAVYHAYRQAKKNLAMPAAVQAFHDAVMTILENADENTNIVAEMTALTGETLGNLSHDETTDIRTLIAMGRDTRYIIDNIITNSLVPHHQEISQLEEAFTQYMQEGLQKIREPDEFTAIQTHLIDSHVTVLIRNANKAMQEVAKHPDHINLVGDAIKAIFALRSAVDLYQRSALSTKDSYLAEGEEGKYSAIKNIYAHYQEKVDHLSGEKREIINKLSGTYHQLFIDSIHKYSELPPDATQDDIQNAEKELKYHIDAYQELLFRTIVDYYPAVEEIGKNQKMLLNEKQKIIYHALQKSEASATGEEKEKQTQKAQAELTSALEESEKAADLETKNLQQQLKIFLTNLENAQKLLDKAGLSIANYANFPDTNLLAPDKTVLQIITKPFALDVTLEKHVPMYLAIIEKEIDAVQNRPRDMQEAYDTSNTAKILTELKIRLIHCVGGGDVGIIKMALSSRIQELENKNNLIGMFRENENQPEYNFAKTVFLHRLASELINENGKSVYDTLDEYSTVAEIILKIYATPEGKDRLLQILGGTQFIPELKGLQDSIVTDYFSELNLRETAMLMGIILPEGKISVKNLLTAFHQKHETTPLQRHLYRLLVGFLENPTLKNRAAHEEIANALSGDNNQIIIALNHLDEHLKRYNLVGTNNIVKLVDFFNKNRSLNERTFLVNLACESIIYGDGRVYNTLKQNPTTETLIAATYATEQGRKKLLEVLDKPEIIKKLDFTAAKDHFTAENVGTIANLLGMSKEINSIEVLLQEVQRIPHHMTPFQMHLYHSIVGLLQNASDPTANATYVKSLDALVTHQRKKVASEIAVEVRKKFQASMIVTSDLRDNAQAILTPPSNPLQAMTRTLARSWRYLTQAFSNVMEYARGRAPLIPAMLANEARDPEVYALVENIKQELMKLKSERDNIVASCHQNMSHCEEVISLDTDEKSVTAGIKELQKNIANLEEIIEKHERLRTKAELASAYAAADVKVSVVEPLFASIVTLVGTAKGALPSTDAYTGEGVLTVLCEELQMMQHQLEMKQKNLSDTSAIYLLTGGNVDKQLLKLQAEAETVIVQCNAILAGSFDESAVTNIIQSLPTLIEKYSALKKRIIDAGSHVSEDAQRTVLAPLSAKVLPQIDATTEKLSSLHAQLVTHSSTVVAHPLITSALTKAGDTEKGGQKEEKEEGEGGVTAKSHEEHHHP